MQEGSDAVRKLYQDQQLLCLFQGEMGRSEANGYMVMSLSIKLGIFMIFYAFPMFELFHILNDLQSKIGMLTCSQESVTMDSSSLSNPLANLWGEGGITLLKAECHRSCALQGNNTIAASDSHSTGNHLISLIFGRCMKTTTKSNTLGPCCRAMTSLEVFGNKEQLMDQVCQ